MKQSLPCAFLPGQISLGLLVLTALLFSDQAWGASSWDQKSPVEYVLSVDTDRADAMYHKGEIVTFNIQLLHDQQPAAGEAVEWTISKDGVPPIRKGTLVLQDGKASVTGSLNEPGFLLCSVTFKHDKDSFTAPASAAIDPLEIKPSLPVPDDFDDFWNEKKKELASVPINAVLTPVPLPANSSGVEGFDLQADCIGAPVSGYYARPTGAKPKGYPAILTLHAAGVSSAYLGVSTEWAQKGFLALDINAHGIPNGKPDDFYTALAAGDLNDYRTRGRESRDTYYFLGMYLRVLRALDFLAAQPEWDGRTLVIAGVSQGGAQAIAGAALDPRVTFVFAGFPAMCDHTGMLAGRTEGWPKLIPMGVNGAPDPAVVETSRYFDSVNFSSRIKAPACFWIGFVDVVTPPTCGYAAYNNIPGEKEVVNDPSHGHGRENPQPWAASIETAFAHVTEQSKTPVSGNSPP